MTVIITDIPQITSEVDQGVMKSLEWLSLTTFKGKGHAHALNMIHGNASSDNNRMHINLLESSECLCSREDTHEKFNKNIELAESAPFAFAVNRQFLVEALAGLNPEDGYLLIYNAGADHPIVITETDQHRVAIIMPIQPDSISHGSLKLGRVVKGAIR